MLTAHSGKLTVAFVEWSATEDNSQRCLQLRLPRPLDMPEPPGGDHYLVCPPIGSHHVMMTLDSVYQDKQTAAHPDNGWDARTHALLLRIFNLQKELEPNRAPQHLSVYPYGHITIPFRVDSMILHHSERFMAYGRRLQDALRNLLYPERSCVLFQSVN